MHQVTVRVPVDFDADECDLGDGLAELDDDGFRGLERNQIVVRDVAPDPAAEFFDPPASTGCCGESAVGAVVWPLRGRDDPRRRVAGVSGPGNGARR